MVAIKDQINLMIAVFLLFFVAFVDAQYMFDVDSEIINNEKVFYPGEEIIVSTDIKSLGTIKDIINVKLNFFIKSSKFLYKYPLAFTAGLSLFFVIIIFLISSLIHKNR